MEPGEITTVFSDPITRNAPEGKAVLVEEAPAEYRQPMYTDNDGRTYSLETWMVRFDGEVETYRRTIRVDLAEAGAA